MRVFLELAMLDYLDRIGELSPLVQRLEAKEQRPLPHGAPKLHQLVPEIIRIAKKKLTPKEANKVEKAVRYDKSAPFTISELHGFVHSDDLPGPRDIEQFWSRCEPLFRLMLEHDPSTP